MSAVSAVLLIAVTLAILHRKAQASPVVPYDLGVEALVGSSSAQWLIPRVNGVVNQDLCQLWIPTYPWTTCQELLDSYYLTAVDFSSMNPTVDASCSGFKPGNQYCILMPHARIISKDGSCALGGNVTCIGSSFGNCCGKSGRCGSTDDFCAIGNCQDGLCPGQGYSTDGLCGRNHGNLLCGGALGKCCSMAGECGSTNAECGVGNCQSGACVGSSTSTTSTTTSVSTSVPLPSPFSPSPDGTCGGFYKYVCTNTTWFYGNCCGPRDYCGYSDWECMDILGCQPEFGLCDTVVVVTASAPLTTATTASSLASTRPTSPPTTTAATTATTSSTPPAGPTYVDQYGTYSLLGCLSEPTTGTGRALAFSKSTDTMTVEECMGYGLGYAFIGLEYGQQCFWADYVLGGELEADNTNCAMECQGSSKEYCGGPSHLQLYSRNGQALPPPQDPTFVQSVGDYKLVGCYDDSGAHALPNSAATDDMTVEYCIAQAKSAGAKYAGIEWARECYWGNVLVGGSLDATTANCNFLCSGQPFEYCGSGGHMTLYSLTGAV